MGGLWIVARQQFTRGVVLEVERLKRTDPVRLGQTQLLRRQRVAAGGPLRRLHDAVGQEVHVAYLRDVCIGETVIHRQRSRLFIPSVPTVRRLQLFAVFFGLQLRDCVDSLRTVRLRSSCADASSNVFLCAFLGELSFRRASTHSYLLLLCYCRHQWVSELVQPSLPFVDGAVVCPGHLLVEIAHQALAVVVGTQTLLAMPNRVRIVVPRVRAGSHTFPVIASGHLIGLREVIPVVELPRQLHHAQSQ